MEKETKIVLFSSFPDVLTVHDVRQALGIGRAAVYHLLDSGELRSFKLGHAYKIPKTALIEYISSQCHTAPEGGASV